MSPAEISGVKNAPLVLPDDRDGFVAWATSVPDGNISAGWQPVHRRLLDRQPHRVLRASRAKLASLARREANRTLGQVADAAGVGVSDVIALEHGDPVADDVVARVAAALELDADVLAQLFGQPATVDPQLANAATTFVAELDAAEPLNTAEDRALEAFRDAVRAGRSASPVG